MSKALSVDLRVGVLAAVADGATHRQAAERFEVSCAPRIARRDRAAGRRRQGRRQSQSRRRRHRAMARQQLVHARRSWQRREEDRRVCGSHLDSPAGNELLSLPLELLDDEQDLRRHIAPHNPQSDHRTGLAGLPLQRIGMHETIRLALALEKLSVLATASHSVLELYSHATVSAPVAWVLAEPHSRAAARSLLPGTAMTFTAPTLVHEAGVPLVVAHSKIEGRAAARGRMERVIT